MTRSSSGSATVSFGMVSVPVRFHMTVRAKDIKFNQLHRECGDRTRSHTMCETCERRLETSEIVKGYDTGDGFVKLEAADLETLPLQSAKSVDLKAFVPVAEVPFEQIEKVYWLSPDDRTKAPHKAFVLLRDTMAARAVAGLGKYARSGKEQLVAVFAQGDAMAMAYLHWQDELQPVAEIEEAVNDVAVTDVERQLGEQLVDALVAPFAEAVTAQSDDYREALEQLIAAKQSGGVVAQLKTESKPAGDLMAALAASVEAAKKAA